MAVVLLVPASGCAGAASPSEPGSGSGPDSAPAGTGTTPSGTPMAPATRAESVVSPRAPRLVVLPGGREVPVRAVGTTARGLLDVPDDVEVAGWWRGGSRMGDPFGSVLVAAHVDSTTQGLGPFADLLTTEPGARLRLESRGLSQAFEISSRRLVPQGGLAPGSRMFAASGDLRLTLVTCAPPYDRSRGGYQNLAVITALPLGPPEAS